MKKKTIFMAMLPALLLLNSSQLVTAENFSTAKSRIARSLSGTSLNGGSDSRTLSDDITTDGTKGGTLSFTRTEYKANCKRYCRKIKKMGSHDICALTSAEYGSQQTGKYDEFDMGRCQVYKSEGDYYLQSYTNSGESAAYCKAACWDQ
jgi:hypothetical protein